jgi:NADH:ubiquinone oxidoreductase subunit F (NADH-binding)
MTEAMTEAMTRPMPAAGGAARRLSGLPRLLPPEPAGATGSIRTVGPIRTVGSTQRADLGAHLARHGYAPHPGEALIANVAAAGLTGRGGAAFPMHRKLAILAAQRGSKVVVANAAESEPASHKDKTLLQYAPHLILDGLQLAAEAVGASQVYLYLHRDAATTHTVEAAIAERKAAGIDQREVLIAYAPPRFLAGQETALANRIQGGPALPTFGIPRVTERGIGGAPTLVQNVETLAHLALIARYGPEWFRSCGTAAEPGSMLLTIHASRSHSAANHSAANYRAASHPRVMEAAIGTPFQSVVPEPVANAVLIGGYHGTWLRAAQVPGLTLDNDTLRNYGAALGAGVIAVLPADTCGLKEAARVTRYLAAESAGQCGPCLNGLPAIAAAMTELAHGSPRQQGKPRQQSIDNVSRWAGLVAGRGACHHPDGAVRFVRSALEVFSEELSNHARNQCTGTSTQPFLPLPDTMPTTEDEWR